MKIEEWNMNELLDTLNKYLSERRGLLPIIGIVLIVINFLLQIVLNEDVWRASSNLFLHLGLIVAIIGILLIRPLQ